MPIYLSKKRNDTVNKGSGQVDSTFERSQPSAFRYITYSKQALISFYVFGCLAAYAKALFMTLTRSARGFATLKDVPTTFVPLKKADCIPLNNPNAALVLPRGFKQTPDLQRLLDTYSASVATPVYRGRKSFHVNFLNRPLDSDIPMFIAMKTHALDVTAPADSLSPNSYEAYIDILSIISTASYVMWNYLTAHGNKAGTTGLDGEVNGYYGTKVDSDLNDFGECDYDEDDLTQKKISGLVGIEAPADKVGVITELRKDAILPWGEAQLYPLKCGAALPYRKDFSSPDPGIFSQFARHFAPIMDKNSLDNDVAELPLYVAWLEKRWRDEICNSVQGEWLAHLMKALIIARELSVTAWVCVKGGNYLGVILGGGKWKLQVGKEVYESVASSSFEAEVQSLDAHSGALDKILDVLSIPKPRIAPTSMRRLREIAIGASGLPASSKATISELLPQLDFGTLPDDVNPSTIKESVRILSDPTLDLPTETYLSPRDFWSNDRYVLILSRFGNRAPSPATGTRQFRFAANAHGTGVNSAPAFSGSPPAVLNFSITSVAKAASDWRGLMRWGFTSIEDKNEAAGPHRSYRGPAATDIWGSISSSIFSAIKRDEGQGATASDKKRGRDDDEGSEDGEIPENTQRKKKKFSFF